MTTATVTAIEPTTIDTNDKTMSSWEIQKRTQDRAEYEYDRALYAHAIFHAGLDAVYMLGHILGKTVTEIKEDLKNVES